MKWYGWLLWILVCILFFLSGFLVEFISSPLAERLCLCKEGIALQPDYIDYWTKRAIEFLAFFGVIGVLLVTFLILIYKKLKELFDYIRSRLG